MNINEQYIQELPYYQVDVRSTTSSQNVIKEGMENLSYYLTCSTKLT
jgi:hypothetical protein